MRSHSAFAGAMHFLFATQCGRGQRATASATRPSAVCHRPLSHWQCPLPQNQHHGFRALCVRQCRFVVAARLLGWSVPRQLRSVRAQTVSKAEIHPFIPSSNRQCDNYGAGRTSAATAATLGVGAGPPLPPPASCRSKQHRGRASRPSGPRAEVRTVALSGTALACRREPFLLATSMLAAGGTTAAVG